MTIDEAIIHSEEVAERYERMEDSNDDKLKEECLQCAADHRQLAEWLTELKQWRRVYGICPSYEMCIPECKEGYNAQIAEYKRLLKAAVGTFNDSSCNKDCHQCKWNNGGCEMSCRFVWIHTDEAIKLIGGDDECI